MTLASHSLQLSPPSLKVEGQACVLEGDWVVAALQNRKQVNQLRQQLLQKKASQTQWDLTGIWLDHIGAQLLWQCWSGQLPEKIQLEPGQADLFKRLEAFTVSQGDELAPPAPRNGILANLGYAFFRLMEHLLVFMQLLGQWVLDTGRVIKNPAKAPWKDLSAQVLRMGAQALPITGLVGLLIGVVFVYLLSNLLRTFGAQEYIVNFIGLTAMREIGPLLAAILVAGRSGSTITAQIGVMRLREELDAMHVLGIPATYRLVWPRVVALAFSMPLVSMWTSLMMIFGGMVVAGMSMDISYQYFLQSLPEAVSMGNIWMNLGKSVVFGILVALIGCHYGLRVKSDTESLGNGTTASVVTSITAVILADAVFAILCRNVPI
ncbi:MlaE family ABC transporter permease [Saezia sanguinis]|uniref:MlaE family ABC transporter permease n=1 Tax=Saezia sanguinis TaxID=1965230 RepID=UPI003041A79C